MGRGLRRTILVVAGFGFYAAAAWAQNALASTAPTPASSVGDPLNALWSLLGTSPVAVVSYLWAKSEQTDRREAVTRMLTMFESEAEHKAALRERLKGQDDALGRMMDLLRQLERKLDGRP